MLDRIHRFLFGDAEAPDRASEPAFASAALLVEAGGMDSGLDNAERTRIEQLLAQRFGLSPVEARDLVTAAEGRMSETYQLHPFTRTIRDRMSEAEKIDLVEMLWDVIYADGQVDDLEANLMRRLGELIYVRDVDIGAARKRVVERRGRGDAGVWRGGRADATEGGCG